MTFIPPTRHEYNPWNLPTRVDFHKATQDLPLPRGMIVKFQIYLAGKTKMQIKEVIRDLDDLINRVLSGAGMKSGEVGYKDGKVFIPDAVKENAKREAMRTVILAKASKDFAEKYLQSLEAQHKV